MRGIEELKAHGFAPLSDSRLAIDARADRHCHRIAFSTIPGRNDRAKAAGRPAGCDDQKIARLAQRRVLALAVATHHAALAALRPFAPVDPRVAENILAHGRLAPPRCVEV